MERALESGRDRKNETERMEVQASLSDRTDVPGQAACRWRSSPSAAEPKQTKEGQRTETETVRTKHACSQFRYRMFSKR